MSALTPLVCARNAELRATARTTVRTRNGPLPLARVRASRRGDLAL